MPKKFQNKAPIFERLMKHAQRKVTSFHTPGHKNGASIDKELLDFTGRNVYYFDVTVFPEVDSLHDPQGPIREAQKLMALAYGVKESLFLVNGSSIGNQSMFLSSFTPGDSVILSRNIHKSVLSGIILSGVWPIWIQPTVDRNLDIIFDGSYYQVEKMMQQFPEVKGVFLTSPTYNGVVTDLTKIADFLHAQGKFLLVDEAHGAHLKFHSNLPVSAVQAGADLCVQSTHKVLSALSQGSVLHFNSKILDFLKTKRIVSMLQTTSPNYLILASIDLARRQMVQNGGKILTRIIKNVNNARDQINHLEYFRVFGKKEIEERGYQFDPLKLTINVRRTGISGYEMSEILNKNYNIQVDCFDMFNLVAVLGVGTTKTDLKRLVNALCDLDKKPYKKTIDWQLQLPSFSTEMVISPRDAMFSYKHKYIPLKKAPGHICAQVLTPYPPGVPILMPGERISQEICDYLKELSDKNIRVSGQEKDTLNSIKVVKYEKK